jgi:hypothetical protein
MLELDNGHAVASECNKENFSSGYESCCLSVVFVTPLLLWRLVLQLLRKIRMCLRKSCHGEALRRRGHEHLGVQSFQMIITFRCTVISDDHNSIYTLCFLSSYLKFQLYYERQSWHSSLLSVVIITLQMRLYSFKIHFNNIYGLSPTGNYDGNCKAWPVSGRGAVNEQGIYKCNLENFVCPLSIHWIRQQNMN